MQKCRLLQTYYRHCLFYVHNPEIIRCHLCIGAFRVLIKQKRLCHASVKFGCAYVVFVGDGAVIRIQHVHSSLMSARSAEC